MLLANSLQGLRVAPLVMTRVNAPFVSLFVQLVCGMAMAELKLSGP